MREAALVILYRLLFVLYAEDRGLLPIHDTRYDDYSLRKKVRDDVGIRMDDDDAFSENFTNYWSAFDNLCRAIDGGDASIGLPPYNGGLFDRERTPLLGDIQLPDQIMANIIDALSFEKTPEGRRYINYRDLGVQQLGSIYERLLEREIVNDGNGVDIRLNIFARKGSGGYYTPDDLVGLIIDEAVGPLVRSPHGSAFNAQVIDSTADEATGSWEYNRGTQTEFDPGGAHTGTLKSAIPPWVRDTSLVNLVDYLADRVIAGHGRGGSHGRELRLAAERAY